MVSAYHEDCNLNPNLPFKIKPDVIAYAKNSSHAGPTDSQYAEVIVEFKWNSQDNPFGDVSVKVDENGKPFRSFVRTTNKSYDTLGQITGYIAAQLGAQYRTHAYSVLIVKDEARILHWDRSGTIVTEPISYDKSHYLADFFYRYGLAPPQLRGIDITVSVPKPRVASAARDALGLGPAASLLCVPISGRVFVVESPAATPYTPPGRATRGSRAWDVKTKKLAYLKDTWRVNLEEFEPEGKIYRTLMKHKVKNIVRCLISADIGGSNYHATKTQNYVKFPWACATIAKLIPHRHYRLALNIAGHHLTEFKSSCEMVRGVRDALIGKQVTSSATMALADIM